MNNVLLAFLGWPEIVAILVIVLILFGAKKLPELAKGLGQGIKEFKKASNDVQRDLHRAMEEEPEPPRRNLPTRDPGVASPSEETKA